MGRLNKQEGDLERLFALYERPMYYYALKITADPYIAEDVVQDAFCKMIKYIDSINYENDREIKSYLLTVIKTCIADILNLKTVEAVRKRLSRAKSRLKSLLKANERE